MILPVAEWADRILVSEQTDPEVYNAAAVLAELVAVAKKGNMVGNRKDIAALLSPITGNRDQMLQIILLAAGLIADYETEDRS